MDSRTILTHDIRIASVLALLLAVTTSAIRPSSPHNAPSRPDRWRRNVAVPPARSTRQSMAAAALGRARIKAIRSESEEKLSGTARPSARSLELPSLRSASPARDPHAFVFRASHPLRC